MISVIVPTLNAADRIGPALGALTPGVKAGMVRELILADGGSNDAIAAIAGAIGARLARSAPGRGTQLAAGAAVARGDWLLFVHADTVLPENWARLAAAHMRGDPECAACFRLRFDAPGAAARAAAGWANLRTAAFGLPYGDQALLIPARLYRALGGYAEIPLMEDVALARKLRRGRLRVLRAEAVTGADRYLREGWLRRGARNLGCLSLYFLGVSPARIARLYGAERDKALVGPIGRG